MPSQNPQPSTSASPFEIVTPSKSDKGGKKGLVVAILVVVFLLLSVVAGVLLVRNNQNIQEKAGSCPGVEACPVAGQPNLLRSCTPGEADGSPSESICNLVGRVEACGGRQYCCPVAGGAWTTNMTACTVTASPTATATATASPTATATATATATGTAAATATPVPTLAASVAPTAQKTALPIPVTGTGWPTYIGAGLGVIVIIASILIAL